MTAQLTIDGGEQHLDGLTDRQRAALDFIRAHQPVSSDEVGALLHELRLQRGGKGHPSDQRCDWCKTEGFQLLCRLRDLGHVRLRRAAGWTLHDYHPIPDRGAQGDDIGF